MELAYAQVLRPRFGDRLKRPHLYNSYSLMMQYDIFLYSFISAAKSINQ
jgi:hypothetical protein